MTIDRHSRDTRLASLHQIWRRLGDEATIVHGTDFLLFLARYQIVTTRNFRIINGLGRTRVKG